MSLTIEPDIVFSLDQSPSMRSDYRFCIRLDNLVDKILGRIAFVSYDTVKLKPFNQAIGLGDIMSLTSGQRKSKRISQRIGAYVDFGAQPTPAAPKCLAFLAAVFYFGAPAAQGWARTMVLSTSRFSISGSSAKCCIIRSQIPLSHQRENRLYTLFQFPYLLGKNRH